MCQAVGAENELSITPQIPVSRTGYRIWGLVQNANAEPVRKVGRISS